MARSGVPYSYVDSLVAPPRVTFSTLQARLLRFIAMRISNGEFSERGLARLLRVSQPQLHKVLKGNRKLTSELADRVLVRFGISILDLLDSSDLKRFSANQTADRPDPTSLETYSAVARELPFNWQTSDIPHKGAASESVARRLASTKTA